MMTSIRNPRSESKPEHRVRKPGTEFEAHWRDPERTLVDYVAAAWSRKVWIGIAAGTTMAMAIIYALTRPNVYASQASLMVIGSRSGGSAAEVAANMLRVGNIGPSQVLAALEVVNSSVVAERVVAKLTPAEITKPYQPERASEEERQKMGIIDSITDWMHRLQASFFKSAVTSASLRPEVATEVFRRNFVAWADERAMLIKLVYRAGSRDQAQKVLREVMQVAEQRYREVTAPEQSREWVKGRAEAVEKAYASAQAAYDQFIAAHGRVTFADETETLEVARATSVSRLLEMKRTRDSADDNIAKWKTALAGMKEQRTREREVTEDNANARNELVTLLVEKENLKTAMEVGRPRETYSIEVQYIVVLEQIRHIQARLGELDKPRKVPFVDDNPEYLAIDARIRALTLTRAELDTEIPRLENEVTQQAANLKNLYQLQEEAKQIVDELALAKQGVTEIRRAKDNIEFQSQLDTLGLSSLQPVDTPTAPLLKEGPQRTRIILAGLAAGLLASLTVIMLLVRLSKTFLRTSEVAVCLGRGDVVGMPYLERGNVRRFRLARKRGWD
jgi:uncharacterized protein involved in exopolysaccharide biosynthesis